MAKPKTFVDSMVVDVAKKSHNCQHNRNHRIEMGDKRLSVKAGRGHDRFCKDCAIETLQRDITSIELTISQLEST
jgi:hypothetical protein